MRAIFALLISLALVLPVSAELAEPTYDGETNTIEAHIEASGIRTAMKLDDTTCAFGFIGVSDSPALEVYTGEDTLVSSTPLDIGDWSMPDDTALCNTSVEISVPASEDFRIEIAPYFLEEYTQDDTQSGSLEIEIYRDENDTFPISPIPTGGPVTGTDNIVVVGHLQLRGENYKDFTVMPPLGCTGSGAYSDIRFGMQVTIKNESGTIISVAELIPDPTEDIPTECRFYFVAEIPESTFYSFESGQRNAVTISHDDLVAENYEIFLEIG